MLIGTLSRNQFIILYHLFVADLRRSPESAVVRIMFADWHLSSRVDRLAIMA